MKRLILIGILFFSVSIPGALAQPDQGNPGGSPTPFGFVEVLLVAGAAFGGKKAYDKVKSQE